MTDSYVTCCINTLHVKLTSHPQIQSQRERERKKETETGTQTETETDPETERETETHTHTPILWPVSIRSTGNSKLVVPRPRSVSSKISADTRIYAYTFQYTRIYAYTSQCTRIYAYTSQYTRIYAHTL